MGVNKLIATLINAVQGVLSIILILGLGYFLTHRGWFDDKASKLFSRLVVNVSLPAYMISNLMTTYTKDKLIHLAGGLIVPFASMGLCYITGRIVAKLIKVKPNRVGTFTSMFSLSNTIFVGLPVNMALFGEKSLPYVLLYYIANTSLFWTIGTYGIRSDGGKSDEKVLSIDNLKRVFSPPLTGFIVATILILLGIKLPGSIMDTCKYLGNLTTTLSLLFIGIAMYRVNKKEIRMSKDMVAILFGRFILAPAIVTILCYMLPLPMLMKKVFIIQAAMPVMTQTSIIAEAGGADYKYAAVMTTVTTVVSLLMIPFYMMLLSNSGILIWNS